MTPEQRLNEAVRCSEPVQALRSLALDLAREGRTKAQILALFEGFVQELRARPEYREGDEDAVLDVMDALTGWCHPDARLLAE